MELAASSTVASPLYTHVIRHAISGGGCLGNESIGDVPSMTMLGV